MKIMDSFCVGGAFTEYYAMDWNEDIVLMGHDGPGHIAITQVGWNVAFPAPHATRNLPQVFPA